MQYHSASTMQHCPKFMTVKLSSDALFRKVLTHFRIEMPLCSSMQYACSYLDFLAFFFFKSWGFTLLACQFLATNIWSTTYFPISCRPFVSKIAL